MRYVKNKKFQRYTWKNHSPTAKCDVSGFKVMHKDLRKQYQWYGDAYTWTGFWVHKDFLCEPNPQGKVKAVGGDPYPVIDPRPFFVHPTKDITIENAGNTVIYSGTNVVINPNIAVAQTNGVTDLSNGVLRIEPGVGVYSGDALIIQNAGLVSQSNGLVFYNGVNIGVISPFFNGLEGNILQVTLQNGANNTSASAILQNIIFKTTDTQSGSRVIKFSAVNNGGSNSDPQATNILVELS